MPKIENAFGGVRVTFKRNNVNLVHSGTDVVKDVVKECGIELSERQILILEMIHQNSTISSKTMSEKLSEKKPVDERTVQRDLAILQKNGILSREGGRKNGEWIIHTK